MNCRLSKFALPMVAGAALAAVAGMPQSAAAAGTELLAHTFFPHNHPLVAGTWIALQKLLPEATHGRVTVKLSNGMLGPPNRGWSLATSGVVDLSFIHVGFERQRLLLPALGQLPFIAFGGEANSVAMWRTYKKYFEKANEYKGVKLLSFTTYTGDNIYTREREIKTIDDFKGLKLRTAAGFGKKLVEMMGATAVPSLGGEIFPFVSKGIVDGLATNSGTIKSFKIGKFLKYGVIFPHSLNNLVWSIFMNQQKWDGISKEDQKAIDKVTGENLAHIAGKTWDVLKVEGDAHIKQFKMDVRPANPTLVAQVKKRLAPLKEEWFKQAAKRHVDGPAAYNYFIEQAKSVAMAK